MDVFSQRPSDISDYTSTTVGAGAKSVFASAAAASKQQRTPVGALESKTGSCTGSKVPRGQVESGDDETLSPSSTRVPHDVTPEHVQQVVASGALQLRRGSAAGGGSSNYGTSPSGAPSGEGTTCSTAAAASSSQPLGRDSLDIDELCDRVRRRSFGVGPSSNHGSVPGSKRQSVTFSEGNPVGGAAGGRRGSASGGAGGEDVRCRKIVPYVCRYLGGQLLEAREGTWVELVRAEGRSAREAKNWAREGESACGIWIMFPWDHCRRALLVTVTATRAAARQSRCARNKAQVPPQAALSDKYALGQSRSPVDFGRAGGADSVPTTNPRMTDADRKLALLKEMQAEDDDDEGDQKRGKSAKERSKNRGTGGGQQSAAGEEQGGPREGGLDGEKVVERRSFDRKKVQQQGGVVGIPTGPAIKERFRAHLDDEDARKESRVFTIEELTRQMAMDYDDPQLQVEADQPGGGKGNQHGGASLPLAALRSSSATSHAAALNMNRLMGQEGVDIAYGRTSYGSSDHTGKVANGSLFANQLDLGIHMHMVPPDPESYYKLKAANKLGNAETVMQNVAPTLLADKDRLDRERGGGGAGAGGADNMKAAYRRASTDGVPSSSLRVDRESNSSVDARVHSKPRSSDFISAKEKAFFYNPAASSTAGAERSSRAASKEQTKEVSEGSGVAENIKQSQNHGGGLRRKSTGGVDPKSVNQAKTQLWQLISGVMIPQGTEFSIPFNRGNGALVSAWFRKLRKSVAGSGGATNITDEPAGEPASLERVFELLWPVETTKQLAQVRQWILSFELQEHNKRIKVKPPPLLPTEKVDELEAMYEYLLQGGSEGRRTVEEDEVRQEEVARWVQQEVSAGDVITKETFIKMACPSGYRASETVTNCVSAEGKELILDPELGWIILTSG
eukprot:g858.t1